MLSGGCALVYLRSRPIYTCLMFVFMVYYEDLSSVKPINDIGQDAVDRRCTGGLIEVIQLEKCRNITSPTWITEQLTI